MEKCLKFHALTPSQTEAPQSDQQSITPLIFSIQSGDTISQNTLTRAPVSSPNPPDLEWLKNRKHSYLVQDIMLVFLPLADLSFL